MRDIKGIIKASFLFAFVTLASLCSFTTFAKPKASDLTYDIYRYRIATESNYGGYVIITGLSDEDATDLDIPSEIDGLPVRKIAAWAFSESEPRKYADLKVETVDIHESIEEIDSGAFSALTTLQHVTFHGNNLITIEGSAFSGCTNLENVEIPDSVETLDITSFGFCHSFTEFAFPASLRRIGKNPDGTKNATTVSSKNLEKVINNSNMDIQGIAFMYKTPDGYSWYINGDKNRKIGKNDYLPAGETAIRFKDNSSGSSSSGSGSDSNRNTTSVARPYVYEGKWEKNENVWKLRKADNSYASLQWALIDGEWYRFDVGGNMLTDWQLVDGAWYYLCKDGAMRTGWQYINNLWYYFDQSGHMLTGWQTINGKQYYMSENGAMLASQKNT